MANRRWREGRLSTGFIDEEFPDPAAAVAADKIMLDRLAAVALAIEIRDRRRFLSLPGRLNGEGGGWRQQWVVAVGERQRTLTAQRGSDGALAIGPRRGKRQPVVSDWRPGDPVWAGKIGRQAMIVQVRRNPAGLVLSSRGVTVTARVMAPHVAALAALVPQKRLVNASKELRCPMPGLVVRIDVAAGQTVRAGEPLAVVEAMKMENVLRAERDATVARLAVAAGDTLAVDDVIMEFE